LFNKSILENVRYGLPSATLDQVERACERAEILHFIKSLPDGWGTLVGDRGLKLSGGEKQRLAIARCLLKDAPLILADECTGSLDIATANRVQCTLSELTRSRTCICITHRLSFAKDSDQIIVLGDTKVLESGTHDELLRNQSGPYAQMWDHQTRRRDETQ
jgi:ATP-binding cassette subfamily B protein